MEHGIRTYSRRASGLLQAQSAQDREKLAAHALALLLVCAVALVKYVTGLTVDRAPFTLYTLAIVVSAARGGFGPAVVATLASVVVGAVVAPPVGQGHPRLLFAFEGLGVALIASAIRSHLRASDARLAAAQATIADLKARDRHGRLLDAALHHLEETCSDTVVVVLNDLGLITEWRGGAARLYGFPAEEVLGVSIASLFFDTLSPGDLSALLRESAEAGSATRSAVHRRRDGGSVHVEIEIRPIRDVESRGFTLTVHDVAMRREWDDYRAAADQAQLALQQAADTARQQLAALESLTDPSLNPLGGAEMVSELLERLRATISADGAALVQPGRVEWGVIAARGLQPMAGPIRPDGPQMAPGRVAVVHNDAARVVQLSGLRWSASVTSLIVVPVVHDGQVWSTIEVVSQRARQVSDWDVALVRVVADRLAAVVAQNRGLAA